LLFHYRLSPETFGYTLVGVVFKLFRRTFVWTFWSSLCPVRTSPGRLAILIKTFSRFS